MCWLVILQINCLIKLPCRVGIQLPYNVWNTLPFNVANPYPHNVSNPLPCKVLTLQTLCNVAHTFPFICANTSILMFSVDYPTKKKKYQHVMLLTLTNYASIFFYRSCLKYSWLSSHAPHKNSLVGETVSVDLFHSSWLCFSKV